MVTPEMQRVVPLEEITMSNEWDRVSIAEEGFEEPVWVPMNHSYNLTRSQVDRSGLPIRLITLLSAAMTLGMLACTSEQTPSEPSGSPSLTRATAGAYTAVDLGTLGGFSATARGINPAGQVVGESYTGGVFHAFLWEKGVMTDLGTLPASPGADFSRATGINPAGQVVGYTGPDVAPDEAPVGQHAFLWEKGVMTDLGTLGGTYSRAFGINPAGDIVGMSETAGGDEVHATLWTRK
jgi:probable HAF family extracellular repeat protein